MILPKGVWSEALRDLMQQVKDSGDVYTRLYKEQGIFKVYMKLRGYYPVTHHRMDVDDSDAEQLCPVGADDEEMRVEGENAEAGRAFRRQPRA